MVIDRDVRINHVYNILRGKMKGYGRNVSLPQNTDPKKTYSWRYLSRFVERLECEGITDEYVPAVVDALLLYAKRHKLLDRGFAVLNKVDIASLLEKRLTKDEDIKRIREESILSSHDFLLKKHRDSSRSLLELLITRKHRDAYTNMTCWFEQGFLRLEYIAISKTCRRALCQMKINERILFPGTVDLMKMRLSILSEKDLTQKLTDTLKTDLMR